MKISIITPVFNGASTISDCIESVLNQTHQNIEHIIVDGGSVDETVSIIKKNNDKRITWISEKDKGLYDAFNKGIKMATGDIICFLCADDMYINYDVLKTIAGAFERNPDKDIVFSDIIYVRRNDLSRIVRYWRSSPFRPGLFKKGWLPPNTALFIRKSLLDKYENYNTRFRFAADYELQYRLFEKFRTSSVYHPGIMVKMRSGGVSNSGVSNIYKSLKDCYDVLKYHKVKYPLVYIMNTLFYRIRQVFIPSHLKKLMSQNKKKENTGRDQLQSII